MWYNEPEGRGGASFELGVCLLWASLQRSEPKPVGEWWRVWLLVGRIDLAAAGENRVQPNRIGQYRNPEVPSMSQSWKKNSIATSDASQEVLGPRLAVDTVSGTPTTSGRGSRYSTLLREAALAGLGTARPRLEIDLPAGWQSPLDDQVLVTLVRSLVKASIECAEDCGELLITICESDDVVEIEVADDGPPLQERAQRLPMAAAAVGAELVWQDCPQGGVALTAIIPRAQRRRLAA